MYFNFFFVGLMFLFFSTLVLSIYLCKGFQPQDSRRKN